MREGQKPELRAAIYRQVLSERELAAAVNDADRIMRPLDDDYFDLLADRYAEGRSGIVLEQVAEGFAFRAAREEAAACSRLFARTLNWRLFLSCSLPPKVKRTISGAG